MRKEYKYSEITEVVHPEDVDLSSFEIKKKLNPEFWHNDELDPYVRKRLLQIARDFILDLEIENVQIEDILFLGSLANYNWNEEYSDIDMHIVIDFKNIMDDADFVKKYFDTIRKSWNQKHEDLLIHGYPVEIYVQDKDEKCTASGIYSVLDNKWIETPSPKKIENKNLDDDMIKKGVSDFMNQIDDLNNKLETAQQNDASYDELMAIYDEGGEILEKIKESRKSSLKGKDGKEMTEGNLIFKSLRRNDYMEKLFDIRRKAYDIANSI